MHIYNLCRICLTECDNAEAMHPLFDSSNSECALIVRKIEECGGIELKEHEEFPKMICPQCLESLNTSHKFRSMCQASEHALLDVIVKSELENESIDETIQVDEDHLNVEESDSQNEILFDLHTEFIEAKEVELDELTNENKLNFDFLEEENALLEYVDDSADSDFEVNRKSKIKRRSSSLKKTKTTRKPGRRGRIKCTDPIDEVKPRRRGRKRRPKSEAISANIMCELCGNTYNKRSLLNLHMRRHLAQKPYECEICGKTFACLSEMSRHIRVHTGEKPFACKYCGRTFADRSTNIKHERIHTNERPFICQTCGKSFTYSNVLKNHLLTHTGEKPFPCIPCNKTFSRKHQLDQHLITLTHQQTVQNMTFKSEQLCGVDLDSKRVLNFSE